MLGLRFFNSSGGVKSVPLETIENYEEDESGQLRRLKPVVVRWGTEPDLSDRQTLRIYREDLIDTTSALAWITGQTEINFSTQQFKISEHGSAVLVEQKGPIVEVRVYGHFAPELSEDDIHAIVADYRLLYNYFPSYSDIFKIRAGENRLQSALLEYLIETISDVEKILQELGVGKKLKSMPEWIKRVLQLRKSNK